MSAFLAWLWALPAFCFWKSYIRRTKRHLMKNFILPFFYSGYFSPTPKIFYDCCGHFLLGVKNRLREPNGYPGSGFCSYFPGDPLVSPLYFNSIPRVKRGVTTWAATRAWLFHDNLQSIMSTQNYTRNCLLVKSIKLC